MPYGKARRYSKRTTTKKRSYSRYRKRTTFTANRALRIARNVSKKVAGEVCKWQVTPRSFSNINLESEQVSNAWQWTGTINQPLLKIQSGIPWIMPINWLYSVNPSTSKQYYGSTISVDGQTLTAGTSTNQGLTINSLSVKNPIWYNTLDSDINTDDFSGSELQYKLAYIYLRGIFNASVSGSENNTDGAMRIVIVKDKQPSSSATWADNDRGVFTMNKINAQLNPRTVGRFKIIYDKTLRFNTINGYKPFKYFKRLSNKIRNASKARPLPTPNSSSTSTPLTPQPSFATTSYNPPINMNAYYLMIYSDGLNFTCDTDASASTSPAGFYLFSRVGYYNN